MNPNFIFAYINGVSPLFELEPLIKKVQNLETLIDVGSNKGQFSLLARKHFPNIEIYSFEPINEEIKKQKKILGNNKITYYNFALGSRNKLSSFYITNRKDSSSLLKPIESTNKNYNLNEIRNIKVNRLDKILEPHKIKRPSLLKLDVQGYELEVLKGSSKLLENIDYLILEVSYLKSYENQILQKNINTFILSKFFNLIFKCNTSKIGKKLFQEDCLYSKKIKNFL